MVVMVVFCFCWGVLLETAGWHGSVSRAEDDGAETVGGGHHWESRLQYQGRGEQKSLAKGCL